MKILTALQTREADAYTIQAEPIPSIELMERACRAFVGWFAENFGKEKHPQIRIFCGTGNNGGDGLAIARILAQKGYQISVYILEVFSSQTAEYQENLQRLKSLPNVPIHTLKNPSEIGDFPSTDILIDAILAAGLTRSLSGDLAALVEHLDTLPNVWVAVDMPTGLSADSPTTGVAIQANYTFTFQTPKLGFMFAENFGLVGEFVVGDIGVSAEFLAKVETPNYYLSKNEIKKIFKKREKFAHKGVYGHALLVVGSYGKMGAAILATKACLRSGAGLVTAHVPTCGYDIIQISVPEAMVSLDEDEHIFSRVYDLHKYTTLAVGCGLSTKNKTRNALCYVLKNMHTPVVLDADALNILGQSPDWLEFIPKNSILTPHQKEFERLFGESTNSFERNHLQRQKAKELGVYVILKGANSCIATPEGDCYFNSTGNPGMGTAGSGDVLTGILSGLLAQHYTPLEACLLGVFLHGLAGDLAAAEKSQESLIAGDLIDYLGKAFLEIGG